MKYFNAVYLKKKMCSHFSSTAVIHHLSDPPICGRKIDTTTLHVSYSLGFCLHKSTDTDHKTHNFPCKNTIHNCHTCHQSKTVNRFFVSLLRIYIQYITRHKVEEAG